MPKGLKGFQKGHKINIGKKYSIERIKKISDAQKGKYISPETKNKIREARLKQIMPQWVHDKKSRTMKALGANHWTKRVEVRKRISLARLGKPVFKMRGDRHWNWKGGITPHNRKLRCSLEYTLWRRAVLSRDNYKCIWCGSKEKLEVDHIKKFSLYPELRFAIDNGRTLCSKCHKTTYGTLY